MNTELNPLIWDTDTNMLLPQVKSALMKIAEDFIDFLGVEFEVSDVIVTGSNANFNYTDTSDIDLHIIPADTSKIKCDREVDELFDTKRLLYKQRYDLTIRKIPVELYVESEPSKSKGKYSILTDTWITEPSRLEPHVNQDELKHMIKVWTTVLRSAKQTRDLPTLRSTLNLLRLYRTKGLGTPESEFSTPNLVYKHIRNTPLMTSISKLVDELHDNELSLPQE